MKFETQTSKHYSGGLLEIWSKILFNQNFLLITSSLPGDMLKLNLIKDLGLRTAALYWT